MENFRIDGLDNPMSPNGPNPLYYVRRYDAAGEYVSSSGPYGCPAEAAAHLTSEDDRIEDHRGNAVEYNG